MTLNFIGKYKSITGFEWKDVPKFSVITGLNGAGKSQLLALINETIKGTITGRNAVGITGESFRAGEVSYLVSEWRLEDTSPIGISLFQQEATNWFNQFNQGRPTNLPRIDEAFQEVEKKLGKHRAEINLEEFAKAFPPFLIHEDGLMSQQIAKIFVDYRFALVEALAKGETHEGFIKKNGQKPWVVLKDIIDEAKLQFRFNNPEDEDIKFKEYFHFSLKSTINGDVIKFMDLSSGERVLFSLVFYLYNSQERSDFPKLLLLDEPDAHLHPSMTSQFINVVQKTLVQKYDVRVIMTTHSPSTVALSPDESIFIMGRTDPRIVKADSKNKAISLLTDGLVFVGKGARYVLVEDEDDVDFYTINVKRLVTRDFLSGEIPLIFIPASTSIKSGGKTVVQDWVKKLSDSGLKVIIQGLIDEDDGNAASEGINVLERYSFENYLLDPLIVFAVLLDHNIAPSISGISLNLGDEHKISKMDDSELQRIADVIHSMVEPSLKNQFPDFTDAEKEVADISFVSDKKLKYPKWILNRRGKTLLNLYRSVLSNHLTPKELIKAYQKVDLTASDLLGTLQQIQSE